MQRLKADAPESARPSGEKLARVLGTKDAAAIMVSNMIGVGILTFPGIVALSLGDVKVALAVWALGGLVSLAGALVHAELGCRHPHAGGDYVFLREAFGPPAAFLSGWTSFVIGFPGAIAASSLAAAQSVIDAAGWTAGRWELVLLALAFLAALSLVHAGGLRAGKRFQNLLVALKVSILLFLIASGWLFARSITGTAGAPPPGRPPPPPAIGALIVLFAYSGWNSAAYVAGEIRDPRRNLPRALIGGVLVVTFLYLAWNLTYFRLVPIEAMGSINVGGEIARAIFGEKGKQVLSAALSVVFLGSASAMIITGPRIYYAMAEDGLFPRALTAVGARSGAPWRAVWLQSLWAAGLLIAGAALTPAQAKISETFDRIVDWTAFSILPFAALTTSAVFVLRARDRSLGRRPSFSTPGYPWTALVFVVAAAGVEAARMDALIGVLLVASGVPAYLFWTRRGRGEPKPGE